MSWQAIQPGNVGSPLSREIHCGYSGYDDQYGGGVFREYSLDLVESEGIAGLGYIKLGQPSTTLSGGESQRVKLATELAKKDTGKTLYVLDEPTTGLHFEDIRVLLGVLNKLVDKGNTIIVIEHNLDVIKCADYLIDMGPEGGRNGGQVLFTGTPEEMVKAKTKSYTAPFLKDELKSDKK